jgi:hypothetical protein
MELDDFKTVQIWLKEIRDRYSADEINQRLVLLQKFCEFVEKNPDELIEDVYYFNSDPSSGGFCCEALLVDPAPPKILKKRDFYNRKINEFIKGLEGISSVRDTYGNMIEGFYIYNGIRMLRRNKVWSHPGRVSSK